MPNFQYIARSAAGEEIAGAMQAENAAAVARALDEKKLYPVHVAEQNLSGGSLFGGQRVRPRELAVLYGQLADLLRSGVPLLRSLQTLARATTNRKLSELIRQIHDDVSSGKTLADAMNDRAAVFTPLHAAMVRSGEHGGFLEDVLANLSGFLERQDELRSKIRGALVYPAVLTIIGTLLVSVILVLFVPQLQPLFDNVKLPLPTAMLFALSDLMRSRVYLLVALVVLAIVGTRAVLRSQGGRRKWQSVRIRLPILGRVLRMVSITRFCRILGTMLSNGVPIIQALNISKDATGCEIMSANIEQAAEAVRAGEPLAEPLRTGGLFPAEIIEMIAVAEESNQLEKVLVQIADTVERRTNRQVDEAMRLIEPLILVVLATAIGFLAVGLLYPLFTMSEAIK